MSLHYNTVDRSPVTGSVAMWVVISTLLAAGWTKLADSDGATYSAVGAAVSSGAVGGGGLANNNAWVRLRAPTGTREITIQRGTIGHFYWRIKYSKGAGFVGGSPAAAQTPSATDEVIIWGSGTDAAPGYVNIWGTDNSYRLQVWADDATPYGFGAVSWTNGSGNTNNGVLIYEPVTGLPVEGDNDPFVWHVGNGSTTQGSSGSISNQGGSGNTSGCRAWFKPGLVGESFVLLSGCTLNTVTNNVVAPGQIGTNAVNGKDEEIPIPFIRPSGLGGVTGYKGMSTLISWSGSPRATGDRLSSGGGTNNRLVYNQITVPWDGTAVTI